LPSLQRKFSCMISRPALSTFLVLFLALFRFTVSAQEKDTLRLTLPAAELQLLRQNIPLLTQRYSIDSAKAGIITARLYDNPQVTFENVLYNHTTKKWFDFSYEGQNALQVEQLFKLAGKRNKAVKLAQSGVKMICCEHCVFPCMIIFMISITSNVPCKHLPARLLSCKM
jgi:cobalt-zinc-cadmium efflux system outer membrane protein